MLDCPSSSLIGHEDVAAWPEEDLAALVAAGLLAEADFAGEIECECGEGGLEEVILVDDDDGGEPAAYIVCHEGGLGRIRVPLERLRRWALTPSGLAEWLAAQLQTGMAAEECVADRLWWIGRPNLGHKSLDVFLARGAAWADASAVFGKAPRLAECARPLVLVPRDAPKTGPFAATVEMLSLARLLSIAEGQLHLKLPLPEVVAAEAVDVLLTIHGPDVIYLGQPVKLQPGDRLLLCVLARDPQYWLSVEHISREAWGGRGTPDLDAVKASVSRLRKALSSAAKQSQLAPAQSPDQIIRNQPKSFGSPSKYMLNLDANQVEVTGE